MVFTEEEAGIRPAATTTKTATPGWEEGLPAIQQVTGKVAEAAGAVAETVGGAWQSVKRAVGLPAEPAAPGLPGQLPTTPAGAMRAAGEVAEQVLEEAQARGLPVPQEVQQALQPRGAPQQTGPSPAVIVGGVGVAAVSTYLLWRYLKQRKAKAGK
jgi:hypothetical protein